MDMNSTNNEHNEHELYKSPLTGQSVLGAYHTGVLSLIGQAAAFQGKISLVVRRHKNPELLFSMAGLQLPDLNVDLSR